MGRVWVALMAAFAATLSGCAMVRDPPPRGPKVDAPGKLPEPAPTVPDLAYDSRVLSSFASAQSFQGPLQGGWTLSAAGPNAESKGDLYDFQITEKRDELGGAWRDLKRGRDPLGSGILDLLQRTPAGLVIRFTPTGQPPVSVTLRPDLKGELVQADRRTAVALRRVAP
jgi:hypothetical protein